MDIATRCICCDGPHLGPSPAVLMPFVAKRVFNWEPVEITPDWGFRDLQSGHAYSVCNTLRCEQCGVAFLDMRFNDAEMASLYRNYRDEIYTSTRERFEPDYRARNEQLVAGSNYIPQVEAFLLRHMPAPRRSLDWGGDTGRNTPFAGALTTHHVYDISDKPAIDGAERIGAEALTPGAYDLIVCSNVLEHVPWPAETVRSLAELMTADTWLYLEVPFEDVMRAHVLDGTPLVKRHWHEHINFFTPAALTAMLQRIGLRVIDTIDLAIHAGGKNAHALGLLSRLA